jgi:small subunit ribosomal protein S24e
MELKNIQKTEKPLLSRTEISGELSYSGATPSKDDLKKKLVEQLKLDSDLVVVKEIMGLFGEQHAEFRAYQYKNKDNMKKLEKSKSAKTEEKTSPEKKEDKKEE